MVMLAVVENGASRNEKRSSTKKTPGGLPSLVMPVLVTIFIIFTIYCPRLSNAF